MMMESVLREGRDERKLESVEESTESVSPVQGRKEETLLIEDDLSSNFFSS
jgi:hypothetical protein